MRAMKQKYEAMLLSLEEELIRHTTCPMPEQVLECLLE